MSDNIYFQDSGLKSKSSWVKQLYYYIILAGPILALSIGGFTFLRANLVRFVFTELENDVYSYYGLRSQCYSDLRTQELQGKNITSYNSDGSPVVSTTVVEELNSKDQGEASKEPTNEEVDKCVDRLKLRRYQDAMLGSILTLIIAGTVLGIHLKFFKIEK